jgi:putative DNA primase/helicase
MIGNRPATHWTPSMDAIARRERATQAVDKAIEQSAQAEAATGVQLLQGSSLKPEPIRWLWPGWLPLGKLVLLAGEPGTGKTTAALSFAATISSGGTFPDGSVCLKGDVLIWSGEDDPTDTLLPRLIAAGADITHTFFVGNVSLLGQSRPFDPAKDAAELLDAAQELPNLRAIIFDPVVNAVSGDSNKNAEVRRALQPLVDFAAKVGAVLIGITHFSKGGAGFDPTTRVIGSVAFAAVARVVMVCAKTRGESGEERRVLARSKSNLGPDNGGFAYSIEEVQALPGIWACRTAWGKAVDGSARELLAETADADQDGAGAEAIEFLKGVLLDGPTPAKTVMDEAKEAGISPITVRRAAQKLGVQKRKEGMNTGWYWSLLTDEDDHRRLKMIIQNDGHLRENLITFDKPDLLNDPEEDF